MDVHDALDERGKHLIRRRSAQPGVIDGERARGEEEGSRKESGEAHNSDEGVWVGLGRGVS